MNLSKKDVEKVVTALSKTTTTGEVSTDIHRIFGCLAEAEQPTFHNNILKILALWEKI